jgi:cytochrome P450
MPADTPVDQKRKVDRGEMAPGCPVHADADGVWHVQDHATAKALLRRTDTRQAGFNAEDVSRMGNRMRMPVLYRDGAEHREHRRQTAKYFTPRRVDTAYRELMERLADEQCAELRRRGTADVWELSFKLAVAVTGEIIGLTEAGRGMARRLHLFFADLEVKPGFGSLRALRRLVRTNTVVGGFYWRDVRPSIAARRKERRDDLISHLIDDGCTNSEILGECVTFAAAGMVTTREFVTLACWHLLTDEALRQAYLSGDEKERVAILHELLRLEPVIGDIYRWTTEEFTVPGPDGPVTIPAGAKLDIKVSAANLDETAVGPDPGAVCPGRELADGVSEVALAFGDGPHRCPGAYIAIQETQIFLSKLLAMPGLRMIAPPTPELRPAIASYELVGLKVTVD